MKIRKTTITVTVLSPEDMNLGSYSLADLAREMDDGASVGDYAVTKEEIIEGSAAIQKACEEVGNDGSFFGEDERTIRVLKSPHKEDYEDDPPPWDYDEDGFVLWVDEVFFEGYKESADDIERTVEESIEHLRGLGYEIEVIS